MPQFLVVVGLGYEEAQADINRDEGNRLNNDRRHFISALEGALLGSLTVSSVPEGHLDCSRTSLFETEVLVLECCVILGNSLAISEVTSPFAKSVWP